MPLSEVIGTSDLKSVAAGRSSHSLDLIDSFYFVQEGEPNILLYDEPVMCISTAL